MSWKKVKLGDILKQYRIEHRVDDNKTYKQVSILNDGSVVLRGEKIGKDIGRKRQFIIDTNKFPNTLIFTRQLLLQGSIGIASDEVHNCIVTENMPMFSIDTRKINKDFLILFLKSKVFKSRISEIELSGSAQKSIHEKTFLNLEFFLPPFQLQKEIVTDFLKLKGSSDVISTELTHQLTLVKKLRQQLLQDAVQGKLVEQNPKDEPASELLKKIKATLRQAQGSKKVKELPPIKPEEIPFEIPEGWVWCRLGEIGKIIGGGTPSMGNDEYWNGDIPWVSPKDMWTEFVSDTEMKVTPKGIKESSTNLIPVGSILIVGRSGILKRKLPVAINSVECTVNQDMKVIIPHIVKMNRFLQFMFWGLESIILKEYVKFGMTVHSLKYDVFSQMPIPLPPLAEQIRIVQKLDELMQHCNELEASIKESKSQNEKLLQQVLREALRKEEVEETNVLI